MDDCAAASAGTRRSATNSIAGWISGNDRCAPPSVDAPRRSRLPWREHHGERCPGMPLAPIPASRSEGFIVAHEQFATCIRACNDCADACDHCSTACLQEDDVKMMARCIALDIDCAAICRMAAAYMARGSEFAGQICQFCAQVCEACGEECAKHEHAHCQECAQACRRCAEECRRMAAA